ncbi:zinc metalloprotease HtpX [Candidatus Campbellbacteria bacterium]|nr:MAG: zinc metalloprotease HtpX [Candidatus Campbellbacteria bacterium]
MAVNAYTESEKNVLKTWLLMSGFLVVVILLGWWLSYYLQNPVILYVAAIGSVTTNFISYFNSDKIALAVSGAKEADYKNTLHRRAIRAVENMSIAAGLKKTPKVYIIQDDAMNAFATGRGPEKSSVAFTTGILEKLNKLELEGVAAHEISHIKNRDILVMTVVVTLVGLISMVTDFFLRTSITGSTTSNRNNNNAVLVLIGIALTVFSLIAAYIIQFTISRKREYLADSSSVLLTRYPEGLASALEKIKNEAKPLKRAKNATAHLFISNPDVEADKDRRKKNPFAFVQNMFSTHPPIQKRIDILREIDQKKKRVTKTGRAVDV